MVAGFAGGGLGADGFLNGGLLYPPVLGRTEPYSAFAAGAVVERDGQPVLEVTVHDTNNTPTVGGFDTFFDNGAMVLVEAARDSPDTPTRSKMMVCAVTRSKACTVPRTPTSA